MRTSKDQNVSICGSKLDISVVIPTLNAVDGLESTLANLGDAASEVIVVDGGSSDGTLLLAEQLGARLVKAERGRGVQMRAGAAAARGGWLLFLHADTKLGEGWQEDVRRFIGQPGNESRAAAFCFKLDDGDRAARRLERLVAWRCRRFGLPYGDQGLLIQRVFYERLGGFKPIPLMEDVDLVRRIGRQNIVMLDTDAVTSAARYRRNGYWRRSARDLLLLSLYWLGVPPRLLVRAYG